MAVSYLPNVATPINDTPAVRDDLVTADLLWSLVKGSIKQPFIGRALLASGFILCLGSLGLLLLSKPFLPQQPSITLDTSPITSISALINTVTDLPFAHRLLFWMRLNLMGFLYFIVVSPIVGFWIDLIRYETGYVSNLASRRILSPHCILVGLPLVGTVTGLFFLAGLLCQTFLEMPLPMKVKFYGFAAIAICLFILAVFSMPLVRLYIEEPQLSTLFDWPKACYTLSENRSVLFPYLFFQSVLFIGVLLLAYFLVMTGLGLPLVSVVLCFWGMSSLYALVTMWR